MLSRSVIIRPVALADLGRDNEKGAGGKPPTPLIFACYRSLQAAWGRAAFACAMMALNASPFVHRDVGQDLPVEFDAGELQRRA